MTVGSETPKRAKDAAATRARLLTAAQELFGVHGFASTSTREIAQRAGVDPALIARYFGSKADLYLAAVVSERVGSDTTATTEPPLAGLPAVITTVLSRMDDGGPGPMLQALLRSDAPPEVFAAARAHFARRLVDPLVQEHSATEHPDALLAAQVEAAAVIGIGLARSLGWFDDLSSVDATALCALILKTVRPSADELDHTSDGSPPLV